MNRSIPDIIQQGEQWLLPQITFGRNCDFASLPSIEDTARAAHYWAWTSMFRIGKDLGTQNAARMAADRIVAVWQENGWLLNAAGDARFEEFITLGESARALFAVHQVTKRDEYADAATQMATRMRRFADPVEFGLFHPALAENGIPVIPDRRCWRHRPGPYQRKAALAFRLIHDKQSYDELDTRMLYPSMPGSLSEHVEPAKETKPPKGRAGKAAAAVAEPPPATDEASDLFTAELEASEESIGHGYSAEALMMSLYSRSRATAAIELLGERLTAVRIVRTTAFAQWCRLRLLNGERDRFPARDIEILCQWQTEAGGWGELLKCHYDPEVPLDIEATIATLQTLWIYNDRSKRSDLPGPLTKRELAIV